MITTTNDMDHLDEEPVWDEPATGIPQERIESLTQTLSRFFDPGEHFEIRCLKPFANGNLVASGGFTNPEEAAIWALAAEIDLGFNVYFGLNPRTNKQPSRELGWGKAYCRRHVARLRWVFIDFDPVRDGGSSTKQEKQHARQLMDRVLRLLCNKYGWPTPIVCDSGNGYHLLFRADLAVAQRSLITAALQALGDQFSTPQVKIDAGVDDAAQITRCYGTLNCKGTNSAERPWRYSRASDGGGKGTVSQKQLEVLPVIYPPSRPSDPAPERKKPATAYTGGRYDVPEILDDCGLEYAHKVFEIDEGEGDLYELAECPWAEEHSTGRGGACVIQFPSGAVSFKCHHNTCADRKWQDFKEQFGISMTRATNRETNFDVQLGAAHTAEQINELQDDDQPALTAEGILGAFQQVARSVHERPYIFYGGHLGSGLLATPANRQNCGDSIRKVLP